MTGRVNVERILDAFLAPEADQLPDRVIDAALSEIARSPQRRALRVPWRFPQMSPLFRLAAVVVLATLAIIGAVSIVGSPRGPIAPTPTPTPVPTATASGTSLDTTAWTPFSSDVFGYDARQPAGWRSTPGTMPATRQNLTDGAAVFFDHFVPPIATFPELMATSSLLPAAMSEDEWVAAYRQPVVDLFGAACFPARDQWEPVTVDGHTGGLYVGCSFVESLIFVDRRVYIFTYTIPAPGAVGSEGRNMLAAFLSTVRFHPERAALVSPAPS